MNKIIFICISLIVLNSSAYKIQEQSYILPNVYQNVHFLNLKDNYTNNLTSDEIKYVINSIAAAERKFNYTQLDEIAKSISLGLATVTNNPWSVLVFNNETNDAGLGVQATKNKSAVIIKTGNYKLSYALLMGSGLCNPYDNELSNNKTQTYQQYSKISESWKSIIRAAASSASTYAGDDVMKAANYVAQKIYSNSGQRFDVIISTRSTQNGAYLCAFMNQSAKLINYADFGWNYYIFNHI